MLKLIRDKRVLLGAALVTGGTIATVALASPPTNFTGVPLVAAILKNPRNISSEGVRFQTDSAKNTGIVRLEFGAKSDTGWHHHPGIIINQVASGRVKVWTSDCGYKVYEAGETFTEGNRVHKGTSGEGAIIYSTFVVQAGQPGRIEDPVPLCDR